MSTKYVQYWSHVFTTTTDGRYAKNFCQSVKKHCKSRTKTLAIAKLFALLADATRRNKSYAELPS